MKLDTQFFHSPVGQLAVVGVVLVGGFIAIRWQNRRETPLPPSRPSVAPVLPRTFTREVARFPKTAAPVSAGPARGSAVPVAPPAKPATLPLGLFAARLEAVPAARAAMTAPYGRLIPCETVVTLESNRIETPVIGLVTEDVWHDGRRIIPAGAEVHGRAALDRARERLAAQGQWRIVWRTLDGENGSELSVDGVALDRDHDGATGTWGEHDGSAGLRGVIVKTDDDRELKLFAATFLGSATTALQHTRGVAGLLGETALPTATARNAVLAGSAAVLREHAEALREAIRRDGFYLRVPAGKPFYVYVTQTINRSSGGAVLASAAPSRP